MGGKKRGREGRGLVRFEDGKFSYLSVFLEFWAVFLEVGRC